MPPSPRRVLSPGQRAAIDCLVRLGAGSLDACSSDREIRSAYRNLVRRYHPDTHPGAGPFEVAALARQFAELTEAYRLLIGPSRSLVQ